MNAILPITLSNENINPYSSFWQRAGAFFLDGLILLPYSFIILYFQKFNYGTYIALEIFGIIFTFFYSIYLLKKFGGTPGKLICGIKVLRKDGHSISWKEALMRNCVDFPYSIYTVFVYIWIIHSISFSDFQSMSLIEVGKFFHDNSPLLHKQITFIISCWIWSELVVILFNKRRRALHDFIAGTVVVKKSTLPYINQHLESSMQG